METSLHRDLKRLYAPPGARTEVRVGRYRIDVVSGRDLIEIQHGSLSALREKVRSLLDAHRVTIVKPIVARKLLVQQARKGGRVVSRRLSPKHGTLLSAFDELVYFTRVFPHKRLTLELVLVEIEEWRYPGHGRRRRWSRRDHVVADQRLTAVGARFRLRAAGDLVRLLSIDLPETFHTGHLAELLCVQRHVAQRIAYCLRETGAIDAVGKQANARLYRLAASTPKSRGRAA